MIQIENTKQFDQLLQDNRFVIVDFWASWCGPCKAIAPEFKRLADSNPEICFVKVDADDEDCAEILDRYRVTALPTFIAFVKSQKVGSMTGNNPGQLQGLVNMLKM